MTNPMFNPQPNYSGVTIQISNPAVNVGQYDGKNVPFVNSGYVNGYPNNQGYINYPQGSYTILPANNAYPNINNPNNIPAQQDVQQSGVTNPIQNTGYPNAYPAQYYLNNYNYANNPDNNKNNANTAPNDNQEVITGEQDVIAPQNESNLEDNNNTNPYKIYAQDNSKQNNDMTKSQNIIGDLNEREAKIEEDKKNTKETKIVALTDEYIKSLENYLNNPNDEIRLMASKEILTRLDEDKDRFDDAALNALLNKMLQDPNKLVRIAALSAFGSQLASGNDYTVKLLHNIQSNPNADKEDVLQAADILLKMSAGVEIKNIPNPSVKDKKEQ